MSAAPKPIPPLTRSQQKLVADNIAFVYSQALKYAQRFGLPLEELIQEGTLAMCIAATKYKPTRAKFTTYSAWWMNAYFSNYRQGGNALLSGTRQHWTNTSREEGKRRDPEVERKRVAARRCPVSIHKKLDGYAHVTLEDMLAHEGPGPDEEVNVTMERAEGRRLLRMLSARSQDIVRRRMQGETLQQIANRYGLSRERVRQLERKALERMRADPMVRRMKKERRS